MRLRLALLLVAAGCRSTVATAPERATEARYVSSSTGRDVSFREFADAVAGADIVFFGEMHDNPATHRAELALLSALASRRANIVVSLEMFERDIQPVLDSYLAGQMPESVFVARSRPWARYNTDYRALVELARAHGWPVVAANVPRPLASAIGRTGIGVLDTLNGAQRATAAREISCPRDDYYDRFAKSMTGHSAGSGPASATDAQAALAITNRFYEAQCVKDETMAESIVAARAKAGPNALVIHFNGAFHSDMRLGTAARVQRRLPRTSMMVISAVPVDDVRGATLTPYASRGDFIIFAPKPPK
jgi:uncharacterized iron-regulated protein